MLIARIVIGSIVAPAILALPYVVVAYFGADKVVPAGGPAALVFVVLGGCALVGVPFGALFLILARLSWRRPEMVVREHLFGWPLGLAAILLFLAGIPAAFESGLAFVAVTTTCAICACTGLAAMKLWLAIVYPRTPNA